MSEPTGPTAPSSTCPFLGTGSLSYGEEHTAAHHGRTSQIKAHPRRARQAYRRHRRDRSRPWRAPDPGAIDEELKNGGSWPTSRPSRLPGAAAASSARAGFLFGVLRRPLRARQGRQCYSSSASGRLLYSETDDRGQVPLPPACPGAATGRRGLCIRRRSSWFLRPQSRLRVDLRVRVLDSNF